MAVKGKEVKGKGKQLAGKGSSEKRKRDDTDKSGGRKRKNSGVLKFFDDIAAEVDGEEEDLSEDDLFDDDDDFLDEIDAELKDKNGAGKSHHLPFIPKEEELSDEELAELLEERYRPGSRHVVYSEDKYEAKNSVAGTGLMPSNDDPTIWRIKCTVGREQYSVFCLMQKYVELQSLGTKLQTISVFALEHAKGYIFVEAYKEIDVIEACKGLCSIYTSRLEAVPRNRVSHLLFTRSKISEVSVGSWARMKYGKYKGDLTQVVAVNDARKRATVKLIPRIDLQAIAKKLSGGGTVKQTSVPVPRLISSSELEDFRPHIQYRRDPESGLYFEKIDGLMLKNGYLYKRVSIESLSCWGVVPSADELQRFEASKEHQSDDTEWLLRLYGEGGRKFSKKSDKGKTSASKSTSGTKQGNGFELHTLVVFGGNDVGVIIGMEDSDRFQILKDSEGGVETVIVELDELRGGYDDRKFTPLDFHMKTISINDAVRVLEGPFKDRQGTIKQIYRGTIFIYDENQLESSSYFCTKSQFCEKLKHASPENDDGPWPPGFQESMAPPKSPPLSPKSSPPKKPWVARGNFRDSSSNSRGDRDGIFSIGQTVRIRVGPLKGYLCRVIAIYRSDVTVKLDCQLKVITVKCEHLSEVRVKNCGESFRDPDSNAEFGSQGLVKDLMDGKGAFGESNGWNSSVFGRNSHPDSSASGFSNKSPFESAATDPKKDEVNDAWGSKLVSATDNKTVGSWETAVGSREDQNSAWDKVATKNKAMDATNVNVGNLGGSADCWDKAGGWGSAAGRTGSETDWNATTAAGGWDSAAGSPLVKGDQGSSWNKDKGFNAGQSEKGTNMKENHEVEPMGWKKPGDPWARGEHGSGNHMGDWNNDNVRRNQQNSLHKGKSIDESEGDFGRAVNSEAKVNTDKVNLEDTWGKASDAWRAKDGSSGNKTDSWNSAAATGGWNASQSENSGGIKGGWNRPSAAGADETSVWSEGGAADDVTDGRKNDQNGSWSKPKSFGSDRGFGWNKERVENKDGWRNRDQEDSWDKRNFFDGDRGSGGRRGRGGRRGGRGNFSRGRSDGWNDGSNGSDGVGRDGWKNSNVSSEDQQDSWKSESNDMGGNQASGFDRVSSWNIPKASNENQPSGWQRGENDARGNQSGWDKSSWNTPKVSAENQSGWNQGSDMNEADGQRDKGYSSGPTRGGSVHRGRGRGNQSSGWGRGQGSGVEGGWKNSNFSSEDQQASWKSESSDIGGNQASGFDRVSSWNIPKASNENQPSGWQRGENDARGNQSGWDKSSWNTPKVENQYGWNQGSDVNDADGKRDIGHSPGPTRGGFVHRDRGRGDQSSGWGRGHGSGEEGSFRRNSTNDVEVGWKNSNASSEDQQASWKSESNQASGFDRVSSWNIPKASNENQPSGWLRGGNDAIGNQSGWDKSSWNTPKVSAENQSGWNQGSDVNEADGQRDKGHSSGPTRGGFVHRGRGRGNQSSGWGRGHGSGEETSDMGGNQASGWDRASDWNIPKASNENQPSGWQRGESDASGNQSGWNKSSWNTSKVSAENKSGWNQGFGVNEADGQRDQGNSSGPARGGFVHRGRGRGNQSSGCGRGRGSGEEGSFRRNRNPNDIEGGWGSNSGADTGNQGGGYGNRGRGRREQSGGRGRGQGFGGGGSFNGNQNNSDGQGDCANSWNQGSDAGKGQWQGWSGRSRDGGGSTSEAGGANSSVKGKDENPWGNAGGSWGGASSSGKGEDENPRGNATGSWGVSSSGKGKDENLSGTAAGSWGKGSDDGGAKSAW